MPLKSKDELVSVLFNHKPKIQIKVTIKMLLKIECCGHAII